MSTLSTCICWNWPKNPSDRSWIVWTPSLWGRLRISMAGIFPHLYFVITKFKSEPILQLTSCGFLPVVQTELFSLTTRRRASGFHESRLEPNLRSRYNLDSLVELRREHKALSAERPTWLVVFPVAPLTLLKRQTLVKILIEEVCSYSRTIRSKLASGASFLSSKRAFEVVLNIDVCTRKMF